MPNWKKVIISGSDAVLNSLEVTTDITASAFVGDGSALTNITAEWDGSHNGDAEITGSLTISGSSADLTVTGNVGIGTTAPVAKLDVLSGIANTGTGGAGANAGSFAMTSPDITINGNGAQGFISSNSAFAIDKGGSIAFGGRYKSTATATDDLTFGKIKGAKETAVSGNQNGYLTFATLNHNAGVLGERMRINSSGNVGIGTTSPSVKLEIAQSADSQGLKIAGFDNESNSNLHLYVDNFGRDTITSSEFLAINSGGSSTYSSAGYLRLRGSGNSSEIELNGDIEFNISATEIMRVNSTGVGIGTGAPSAKLDVEGDINITNANLSNQENTDIDTGLEVVAILATAVYTAGFFDFVIKKGVNVRSGTIYACHDGTNVVHTETTTIDLGNTSDVNLEVDIAGGDMRLTATVTSDDWSVKSLVRGL